MPDRDLERRDELMERGWQKMSLILDKELPQGRRRRGLMLWLPVGLIVLSGAAYMIWPGIVADQSGPAKSPTESSTPIPPEAETSGSVKSDQVFADKDLTSGSTGLITRQITPGDQSSQTPEVNHHLSGISEVSNPIDARARSAEERISTPRGNHGNRVWNPADYDSNIEMSPRISDVKVPEKIGNSTRLMSPEPRQSVMFTELNRLGTDKLSYDRANVQPIQPAKSRFKGGLGLGAYVSTHWTSPIVLQGLEGGLLASWQMTPRLALSTGVAFGHHRKEGIASLASRKQDVNVEFATPDPQDTTNFSLDNNAVLSRVSYDTAEALVNKLNYLHLPLHLDYKLTPKLSVRAGVRFSYMMGAPVSQYGRALPVRPALPGTVAGGYLLLADAEKNVLFSEGLLRRWDVAPVIGIGWEVTRMFAIDVQYQYGTIPYIDREAASSRSDFNRTLSVGLRVNIL